MDIAGLITPDRVVAGLSARDKNSVLQELSKRAAATLNLDVQHVFDAIVAREKLGSTGIGMGTAIPHARLAGVVLPFAIFARLTRAIEFDSVDDSLVDLLFFVLIPPEENKEHLVLLAEIAKRLRSAEFRDKLRDAQDPRDLHQLIVGQI